MKSFPVLRELHGCPFLVTKSVQHCFSIDLYIAFRCGVLYGLSNNTSSLDRHYYLNRVFIANH